MNHLDCVIKRDVYPQKMHSCSKNICSISFFILKISVVYKKNISWVNIARVFALLKDKELYTTIPSLNYMDLAVYGNGLAVLMTS